MRLIAVTLPSMYGGGDMKNLILIILAVICIVAYGLMLFQHDVRSDMAIQTESEFTFNRGIE